MKNIRGKKQFKILIFVLIAVITLGIGYAGITAINLVVNGTGSATASRDNFKVKFKTASITTGEGSANITSDITATFNVSGLTKETDQAVATYTIKNESNGVGAEISLGLENTNSEYFKVTEYVEDTELQAGDTTTATITVEMIKTPIDENPTTTITGTLTAKPKDNASATGTAGSSVQNPTPFAGDSWSTIKTNVQNGNTSQYNIGDTRTVTIGGNNYTVRLVNKTTGSNCGDNDTGYSQTACGFVVEFAEIIEKRAMNSESTNIGGWPATEMRTYLNGTFYNSLPSALKTVIKPTRVISGYGTNGTDSSNFTSTDNIYLLSGAELVGADEYDTSSGVTHQLEYYVNQPVEQVSPCGPSCGVLIDSYPRIKKQYNGSDYYYWLRSARSDASSDFRSVDTNGYLSGTYASNGGRGVAPAFRIG